VTDLLTTRVVARRLGVHTETVLKWMRAGDLPAFKLPSGAIRFREEDLERWLQQRATSGGELSTIPMDAARNGIVSFPGSTNPKEEN